MSKTKAETITGQAAKRYESLKTARNNVLEQAREASRLTIPGLIPAQGQSDPHGVTEQPYTSSGARYVNNVSAKLLVSLFPPERPFFRLEIDADVAEGMGAKLGDAQARLAEISKKAHLLTETSMSRTIWMEALRHLVVAGNCLVYQPDDGEQMRMWRLDQYVVKRGKNGSLREAVIQDEIAPSELTEEVRTACNVEYDPDKPQSDKPIKLYTHIYSDEKNLNHYEEINGVEVPGSRGAVSLDKAGWQALRWQAVPGSDYGRGYVTEYAGDFLSLEDVSKSLVKFAIEASRILRLVDPNAGIDIEELASAESGDFLSGMKDRIQTLQLDKTADFQIVWQFAQAIERRLSQAFLITTNAIRDAERVTAEEIRAIAQELEDALGGTYTVLSAEVQRPYANRLLYILSRQRRAPELPDSIQIGIVTGFNALGQNHESATIRSWLASLNEVFGPGWAQQNLNALEIAMRLGVSEGVNDIATLIRSPDEVAADQEAAAAAQMGTAAAPQLAKGAVDAMAQAAPEDMAAQ